CDTASRWESDVTGTDVQPTWVDYTGGDTLLSVEVTESAIYVGGHQRWQNNSFAADRVGPGAVARPGVAALDPVNGLPFSWNPMRIPRGEGALELVATDAGLWLGSDTEFIGNRKYRRERVAFFPLAGGQQLPSNATA